MSPFDAAVINQWNLANKTAQKMGLEIELEEACFVLKNPASKGSVEVESVDALIAYMYGHKSGREHANRELDRLRGLIKRVHDFIRTHDTELGHDLESCIHREVEEIGKRE